MTDASLLPVTVCIVCNDISPVTLRCIAQAHLWASEILIGFDGNQLPPRPELKEFDRLRCLPVEWIGYSETKNHLVTMAQNDWILSLDGDEVVDEKLTQSLRKFDFTNPKLTGKMRRKAFLGNQLIRFGSWGRDHVIRLYHRSSACWNQSPVHEEICATQTSLQPVKLDGDLLHYTATNIDEVANKNNKYAALAAKKYYSRGRRVSELQIWLAPVGNFIMGYVLLGGFLDGRAGWQIAKENARYTLKKYQLLHSLQQSAS